MNINVPYLRLLLSVAATRICYNILRYIYFISFTYHPLYQVVPM